MQTKTRIGNEIIAVRPLLPTWKVWLIAIIEGALFVLLVFAALAIIVTLAVASH